LRAALLAGAGRVGHHVDLRVDDVGAPNDDEIRSRHLARIGAGEPAGTRDKADARRRVADRRVVTGIFFRVAQAVDAVAHHEPHGARVVVGPDRLAAATSLRFVELLGDEIERVVPGDRRKVAGALRSLAAQRMEQPVGMMDALGVARDLGADHAERVVILLRAANAADRALVDRLDLWRAGRGAIVRTGGIADPRRRGKTRLHAVHAESSRSPMIAESSRSVERSTVAPPPPPTASCPDQARAATSKKPRQIISSAT